MDLGIKGKVALVAASSKGIGKAIAFALADEGVDLSIFSRSEDEIERTASEIKTRSSDEEEKLGKNSQHNLNSR